jgi:hypothetical protein
MKAARKTTRFDDTRSRRDTRSSWQRAAGLSAAPLFGIVDGNAVLVQEDERARERRPLVAVNEWLVLGDVKDVCGCKVAEVG